MGINMKVSGKKIKDMEREKYFLKMGIGSKENSKKIKEMEKVFYIKAKRKRKENGKMMN
jgi:hypothetical protein